MRRCLSALCTVAAVSKTSFNRSLEFVLLLFKLEATLMQCLLLCIQGSMLIVHGLVLRGTCRIECRFMATPLLVIHFIAARLDGFRTRGRPITGSR